MVNYVANADDYRQKYSDLKADRDSLSKKAGNLTEQVNEKIEQSKRSENRLTGEITSLKSEIKQLQANLSNAEREKAALLQKVNSWASIVEDFSRTNDEQGQLLRNTLEELNRIQAEQIRRGKELDETTVALVEKMAIIDILEAERKRLLEEKTELQSRLDGFLRPAGKVTVTPVPVTPQRDIARPAMPIAQDITLKGLIAVVDLKNSMAEISIGAADGVKEGMKFYVTRGDEFICEILIIDAIDASRAVGVLELVQQQPRVGDSVSTNL